MSDLPSFRPRGLIGRVLGNGGVAPDHGFLQWLDLVLRRSNSHENQRPPTGTLISTLASAEPEDGEWKLCNGQALKKADYPDLFAVVGDKYGATATAFNLPDAGNLIMMGAGSAVALMETAGALTQTLTTGNLPAHNHSVTDSGHSHTFTGTPHGHTVTDAGHTHGVTDPGHNHTDRTGNSASEDVTSGSDVTVPRYNATGPTSTETTGVTVDSATTGVTVDNETAGGTISSETTGITVGDTGSGDAFSILPPVLGVNWLIKT